MVVTAIRTSQPRRSGLLKWHDLVRHRWNDSTERRSLRTTDGNRSRQSNGGQYDRGNAAPNVPKRATSERTLRPTASASLSTLRPGKVSLPPDDKPAMGGWANKLSKGTRSRPRRNRNARWHKEVSTSNISLCVASVWLTAHLTKLNSSGTPQTDTGLLPGPSASRKLHLQHSMPTTGTRGELE